MDCKVFKDLLPSYIIEAIRTYKILMILRSIYHHASSVGVSMLR